MIGDDLLTALPLAGFKPTLCLIVFFIRPNCTQYIVISSLLKNDLTALAPRQGLEGPIRFEGPVLTLVPPGKFSL